MTTALKSRRAALAAVVALAFGCEGGALPVVAPKPTGVVPGPAVKGTPPPSRGPKLGIVPAGTDPGSKTLIAR